RRARRGPSRAAPGDRRAVELGGQDLLGELGGEFAILVLRRVLLEPPAEDLRLRAAERAEPTGRRLATVRARMEDGRVLGAEQRCAAIEVAEEELCLRPGRRGLQLVHRLLVPELGVPGDERTLLDDVV